MIRVQIIKRKKDEEEKNNINKEKCCRYVRSKREKWDKRDHSASS